MLLSVVGWLIVLVSLCGGILWLGLQIQASPFPKPTSGAQPERLAIPADLPAPVRRFAQALYGESLPQIRSAIITGRARLAPTGFPMPTRFRFFYDVVRASHYHEIHVTWFKRSFMHIHERNLEGHARLDLAFLGGVDDAPRTNRASIQGYWGEVLAWLPAVALSDQRVRWQTIDDTSARLYLPECADEEAFMVRFHPSTGLVESVETLRYQAEDKPQRWRWSNRIGAWEQVEGSPVAQNAETQWEDAKPWACWHIEAVALNAEVTQRMAHFGDMALAAQAERLS